MDCGGHYHKFMNKRGRPKKKVDYIEPEVFADETAAPSIKAPSEKEHLLALYQELKDLGVYSLSNLENRIARAE